MDEKEQLEEILSLIGNDGEKRLKRFRLRIIFTVSLLCIMALAVLFFPNVIGIQIQTYSFVIFFFFGMAVTKWDSLNKLNRLLPYFNSTSIKNRLDEINT